MSTNYNQLLKDLEIGSVYVKILICFLGCTFMLYPFLCYFTHFFRELSVYEQIFFTLGSSALYLGLGLPFSIMGPVRYPACFYTPMILLTCAIVICIFIYLSVGFFFSASIIMHSTVFRISVSHYHRGNSRFQREKDF
mgnify:CR=1 FL=1